MKTIDGPTPAGGDRAEITYLDEHNQRCEPDAAVRIMVAEYQGDRLIAETEFREPENAAEDAGEVEEPERAAWDESKHPRDPGGEHGGEFIEKGTTTADEGESFEAEVERRSKVTKVAVGWYANEDGEWALIGDEPGDIHTVAESQGTSGRLGEAASGVATGTATQREWSVAYDSQKRLRQDSGVGANMGWHDSKREAQKELTRRVREQVMKERRAR